MINFFTPFTKHGNLTFELTKRDIAMKYRGSMFGLLWSFLNPLLLLVLYSYVFSYVFKVRWGEHNQNFGEFAVILFAGLIIHNFLAETLSRTPSIILNNPNFVKKILFPLEVFVPSVCFTALFQLSSSFVILIIANLIVFGKIHLTLLFVPIIILPIFILSMGAGYFLASIGVFIRDIQQIIGLLITILLFASPIFYPISNIPEFARHLVYLNPLTTIVEDIRAVVIYGNLPNFKYLSCHFLLSTLTYIAGYLWFDRTRKGFADVI